MRPEPAYLRAARKVLHRFDSDTLVFWVVVIGTSAAVGYLYLCGG